MFESIAYAMGPAQPGSAAPSGTEMLMQFAPLILMFLIFWFLLIRPQQKRAKEHKAMLEALKKGDYVITSAGLQGRILEIDDTLILLECGEARLRITRGSVAMLDSTRGEGKAEKPAAGEKNA